MAAKIKADEYLDALYENRLLVFLEAEEDCDCGHDDKPHFHQVGLTNRQFKKVSDAIILSTRPDPELKDGYDMAKIRFVANLPAEYFEGLSSTIE